MNWLVRSAQPDDAPALARVVRDSFMAHVARDWGPGPQQSFLSEITPEALAARLAGACVALVGDDGGQVCGVILLPRPNFVQLCFVATTHLRRGIGSALWQAARAQLERQFDYVKTVELNASPYAVQAYRAMGFFPISKQYHRDGWVATRMACWLPDQDLESAADGPSPPEPNGS